MTWEYLLLRIQGADDMTALTSAGEDGWEGFGVVPIVGNGAMVFLKRPMR